MPLEHGQARIGDLLLGPGTPYRVLSDLDPWSIHAREAPGGPRAWGDGSWSGAEFQADRVVPIPLAIETDSPAGWLTAHQQLAVAFAPVGSAAVDVELRFGWAGGEYLLFGRPRMVEPQTSTAGSGRTIHRCAFVALDPIIYSADQTVESFGLPEFEGGLTVPLTVPFTVDAVAVDGEVDLTNVGTAEVGLTFQITGPVVEPRLSLVRPDGTVQTVRFDVELQAGQWLDVDTKARSVLLDGVVSRRGDTSGEWPLLPSGLSTLRFRAGEINQTAQTTVSFRSGWR